MGSMAYRKFWSLPMHFDLANVEFEILMSAWPPPNQRIGCKFLKPGEVECNKELDRLTQQSRLHCKSTGVWLLIIVPSLDKVHCSLFVQSAQKDKCLQLSMIFYAVCMVSVQ